MNEQFIYIDPSGNVSQPVSLDELATLFNLRHITLQTLVSNNGDPWTPLHLYYKTAHIAFPQTPSIPPPSPKKKLNKYMRLTLYALLGVVIFVTSVVFWAITTESPHEKWQKEEAAKKSHPLYQKGYRIGYLLGKKDATNHHPKDMLKTLYIPEKYKETFILDEESIFRKGMSDGYFRGHDDTPW